MQNWVQQLWNSHSIAVFPSHPCKFVGVGIQDTSSTSECCVFSRLRVGEHFATLCGEPATGGFFKFWKNLPPVTVYPLWIASSSQRWNSCDPHSLFFTWQVHNSTFLYSQISPYRYLTPGKVPIGLGLERSGSRTLCLLVLRHAIENQKSDFVMQ